MKNTIKIEMEIEIDDTKYDVLVSYHWEKDGIGAYEFWGFKGYDPGIIYPVIEEIEPLFTDAKSQFENFVWLSRHITANFDKLAETLGEEIIARNDCYASDDPA